MSYIVTPVTPFWFVCAWFIVRFWWIMQLEHLFKTRLLTGIVFDQLEFVSPPCSQQLGDIIIIIIISVPGTTVSARKINYCYLLHMKEWILYRTCKPMLPKRRRPTWDKNCYYGCQPHGKLQNHLVWNLI